MKNPRFESLDSNCQPGEPNTEIFNDARGRCVPIARAMCSGCVIQAECLSFVIDKKNDIGPGPAGGLTPAEINAIRSHSKAQKAIKNRGSEDFALAIIEKLASSPRTIVEGKPLITSLL